MDEITAYPHKFTSSQLHVVDHIIAEYIFGWKWTSIYKSHAVYYLVPQNGYSAFPTAERPNPAIITIHSMVPAYTRDIGSAWQIVTHLRNLWTNATDGVSGMQNDFPRPFDDGLFFDRLHRAADRRWPWAMLYLTPANICVAALDAVLDFNWLDLIDQYIVA